MSLATGLAYGYTFSKNRENHDGNNNEMMEKKRSNEQNNEWARAFFKKILRTFPSTPLSAKEKKENKKKKGSIIPEGNLLVLNVAGILVGFRSSSRETVNDPRFPSVISSCSGFKGSVTGFPNTSSTVATTLPDLQVKETH